jgi:8-oxo-dGTP diphosphatase
MSEAIIAAAVIVSKGTVLLIQRSVAEGELSWQFPAGKVEPGETPADAAVREAHEEVDLVVAMVDELGDRAHPISGRTVSYFACQVVAGSARAADVTEVADVKWCDRAELQQLVPYPLHGPVEAYLEKQLPA